MITTLLVDSDRDAAVLCSPDTNRKNTALMNLLAAGLGI